METPEQTKARIAAVLRGKRADFETLHRTKQGKIRNVLVTAQKINVMGQPVYHCVWRDITEQKELELKLLQAQKLEAIGQLAGRIAHDFRNHLTVVKGFAERLSRRSLVKDEGRDALKRILDATDRATATAGDLLAFARAQPIQPQVINLAEEIADIADSLSGMIGEDIRLSLVSNRGPCDASVDPGQLRQALLNLVVNACDAMVHGGVLTLATDNVELDDSRVQGHPNVEPGRYVTVAVTDTGTGISDEARAHLFEPFFTTKEVGRGTGLGLSMVHGFVGQSGGFIEVESDAGKGATFRLYFPCAGVASAPASQPAEIRSIHGGTETVFVVEDEEPIRTMLVQDLQELGYTVLTATDSKTALSQLEKHPGRVDLLLTDIVMLGGSGVELAARIREIRPGIRVLLISGYGSTELARRGVVATGAHFLSKPFSSDQLAESIRSVLAD